MTPKEQIDAMHRSIEDLRDATTLSVLNTMSATPKNTLAHAIWGTISTILGTYFMLTPEQQKEFLTPKTPLHQMLLDAADAEAAQEAAALKAQRNISNN